MLLVGALIWLASRARASARAPRDGQAVLTDEAITAADLRARAEAALAEGGTRMRSSTRSGPWPRGRSSAAGSTRLPARPRTRSPASWRREYPERPDRVDAAAARFDSVLYGDRPATREQALDVLALDDDLAVRR